MRSTFRWYSAVAIVFMNTCLLALLLNIVFGFIFRRNESAREGSVVVEALPVLNRTHPGWTDERFSAFMREERAFEFEYEPFTQYRVRPTSGRFVNVSPHGFRLVKHQGPWPPDRSAANIFFFGGSTAYGANLPDDETIPSYLQEAFARTPQGGQCRPVRVYNFGRPGYFSSQERALFEALVTSGLAPDAAVFFQGLNEFLHWHGEPQFTPQLRALVQQQVTQGTGTLRRAIDVLITSSLARGLDRFMFGSLLSQRPSVSQATRPDIPALDDPETLERTLLRWHANKRVSDATSAAFRIDSLVAWQPIPYWHYDLAYHAVYRGNSERFGDWRRSGFGYALMDRWRQTRNLGPNFVYLADIQSARHENLYVDTMHYTAAFSREIAAHIHRALTQQSRGVCR